ncbi:M1 family peptidase, partial [Streptomyces sp. NPDC006265]
MTAPAVALVGTAAAPTTGIPAQAAGRTGAVPDPETLGDPVHPALGNDGYRVSACHLEYDATTTFVEATAALTIRTTQTLSRLSLDARGLDIRSVRVDGRTAAFEQVAEKLRITPARQLAAKARATVSVAYGADPRRTPPPAGGHE